MFSSVPFGNARSIRSAKQDETDFTILFVRLAFADRSNRSTTGDVEKDRASRGHLQAATDIGTWLMRSNNKDGTLFSDLAEKLFALDVDMRFASGEERTVLSL